MSMLDLLDELRISMFEEGIPPMDLVVALMGYGIDVKSLLDDMESAQ
jgi:hypothetical protein